MGNPADISVSVVIATRNPRRPALDRTLSALRAQDLAAREWELIVVDNGSTPPLAEHLDLGWHPRARTLVEPAPGKAHALAAGILAASAAVIVVLDDDNELAPDYLRTGASLFAENPRLGMAGGQILPEFEAQPAGTARDHLHMLAIVRLEAVRLADDGSVMPPGAGCLVRSELARAWAELFRRDPLRRKLGSRLEPPCSLQEDTDMCLLALARHAQLGQFPQLTLTHLIARERVGLDYLLRLTRANGANSMITRWLWDRSPPARPGLKGLFHYLRLRRLPRPQRDFALEFWRGERAAARFIARHRTAALPPA